MNNEDNKNQSNNSELENIINSMPTSQANNVEAPKSTVGASEDQKEEPIFITPSPTETKEEPVKDNNIQVNNDIKIDDVNVLDKPANNNSPTYNNVSATIGTIKPDKQKSPIAMIFLFTLLVLFMLFMPQIISFVNEKFGTNFNTNSGVNIEDNTTNNDTSNQTNNQSTTNTENMYDLKDTTKITIDKLELSGFTKGYTAPSYNLSLTIKNTDSTSYTFSKKLYLEFYDKDNTFLSRSLVDSSLNISANSTVTTTVYIGGDTYNSATKIEAVLRTSDDYPSITLNNNKLTCTNTFDKFSYEFSNDALTKLSENYTYTKTSDVAKYNNDLLSYKANISRMDALDGVEAVLTETDTGFVTSMNIDYSVADYSKFSYKTNIYDKNTLAKVISFEMVAKGYTCE